MKARIAVKNLWNNINLLQGVTHPLGKFFKVGGINIPFKVCFLMQQSLKSPCHGFIVKRHALAELLRVVFKSSWHIVPRIAAVLKFFSKQLSPEFLKNQIIFSLVSLFIM